MFKVNKKSKKLEKVSEASFKELECKERQDLQEWIVSEPTVLGEDLLIIQKEFAGFENTNERLDLLALDKQGNLVIIENKTDDTGKDVVWQAVKYASYCSTLLANEIKDIYNKYIQKYELNIDAEQSILDFLGADSFDSIKINSENTQRIMLVSKTFRCEVLSAAMWLINYGVNISCIQVTPYKSGDEIFLDSDQILPQKETQEYTIKLASKAKESQQTHKTLARCEELRSEFWKILIPKFNEKSQLYKNISYENRKDHWLGAASGVGSGVSYNFLICKDYCGVELSIASSDKDYNKRVYDYFYNHKDAISDSLSGYKINWQRLDSACMSRIAVKNENLSLYDKDSWKNIVDYLINLMNNFEETIKGYVPSARKIK